MSSAVVGNVSANALWESRVIFSWYLYTSCSFKTLRSFIPKTPQKSPKYNKVELCLLLSILPLTMLCFAWLFSLTCHNSFSLILQMKTANHLKNNHRLKEGSTVMLCHLTTKRPWIWSLDQPRASFCWSLHVSTVHVCVFLQVV